MICPRCETSNPDPAENCSNCGLDLLSQAATATPPSAPAEIKEHLGEWRRRSHGAHTLPNGFNIGNRYLVLGLLGRGGMGAVYRVYDRELDRQVALKLISAELDDMPVIVERFKREIQLSSTITHRNVLRVYDLGESEGVKFLTMQCVDGEDLGSLLHREGALPVERAVKLFRQVCEGIAAAHAEGVIHRDLKPQNIMVDRNDHVYVTDFGLAWTEQQMSITASGAVMGTPYYMSPEQVKGEDVDQRSDIYSLGVVFFEMLTGKVPYSGKSAYEIMMQRVQRDAPSPRKINPQVPQRVNDVVERCLVIDKERRYQTVQEILADLDGQAPLAARRYPRSWVGAGAAAAILLASAGGLMVWRLAERERPGAGAALRRPPVSVLIADLENRSGDPIFDETLEPILSIGLEGAPFITAYNRGQARRTADQLRPGTQILDEALARLVALRDGVQVVIAGSLQREPDAFRLMTRAIDTASGRELGRADQVARDREAVLKVTGTVAQKLRVVLGDAPSEALSSETFTAASLAAAQKYAMGQDLQWAGKYEEAIANYAEAARLDPTMGRAYAGMAAMYANLGDREQAEKSYKLAMQHIDRMTDREKYRTRGGYYLLIRNHEKAIEEYSTLARQYPADTAALNNLALSYFYRREMKRAMEEGRRPVAIYPKNVLYRNNLALYAMYASDFDTAAREAQEVLQLNPEFVKAHVALALSNAVTERIGDAETHYRRLQGIGGRGASFALTGLADLALFRGDSDSAIAFLQKGIEADEKAGNNSAAARKRSMLAEALCAAGKRSDGTRQAKKAAEAEDEAVLYSVARVLAACGDFAASESIAGTLEGRIQTEPQLYAKLLRGEVRLLQGKPREALAALTEAKQIADSWMGRLLRGRAYIELGAFTEAYSDLDTASKRVGEGVAVLLDDIPTARLIPLLYYHLGRAQQGLGSPAARASFEKFLRARSSAETDPLVLDARRRLAAS